MGSKEGGAGGGSPKSTASDAGAKAIRECPTCVPGSGKPAGHGGAHKTKGGGAAAAAAAAAARRVVDEDGSGSGGDEEDGDDGGYGDEEGEGGESEGSCEDQLDFPGHYLRCYSCPTAYHSECMPEESTHLMMQVRSVHHYITFTSVCGAKYVCTRVQ